MTAGNTARVSGFLLATAIAAFASMGCGRSPAMPPPQSTTAVPADRVMIVPADRVVEECPCEEGHVRAKPVEYVRIDEWQPTPSVQELESKIVPRGDSPPSVTQYPKLTMHQPIAPTTVVPRWGWRRYR
jgi:hypothetical protein